MSKQKSVNNQQNQQQEAKEVKEFTLIPASFIIKKVINEDKAIYFFDNGLYPNARRFYISKNLIDFLVSKNKLNRLNARMFSTNAIQFCSVKLNENETSIISLGENMLNSFLIRIPITNSDLVNELKSFLDATDENVVIDYDVLVGSDSQVYLPILIMGKPNFSFEIAPLKMKVVLSTDGIKLNAEEDEEHQQKQQRKVRYNKAGIPILE